MTLRAEFYSKISCNTKNVKWRYDTMENKKFDFEKYGDHLAFLLLYKMEQSH